MSYDYKKEQELQAAREREARLKHEEEMARIPPLKCFAAGTQISTKSGCRTIKSLRAGDLVYAFCETTGQINERPIKKYIIHSASVIWEIRISNDNIIRTTSRHLFMTDGGWKSAKNLLVSDKLRTVNGFVQVVSSNSTGSIEPVYNIVVTEDLTFIADGVVAHSFVSLRALRSAFHRLQNRLHQPRRSLLTPC